MKRFVFLTLMISGLSCALWAQAPAQVVDTTVCDVVKKPASFDGKMVRIKGTVVAGFDEFVIKDSADPNCGFPVNAIWLSYPQGTKGKAGPAAILQIQPARNFAGTYKAPTRTPVSLDKNKDFKQFDSLLAQTHQKGLDMCLGCTRYEVSATLVGRLDAVNDPTLKRDASGKIIGFGGFGNMNAYPARLVLQSVSDVTPKEIDFSKNDDATKGDTPAQFGSGDMPSGGTDISAAIANGQKAAAALAAGPAKDQAVKAAAAFGKPGDRSSGVSVAYGTTNEVPAEALGSKDSPDGILFNCILNEDRVHGDPLMRTIAHFGEHVAELRNPDADHADAPAYILESDAWVVTTLNAIVSGQKFLTLPGGYLIWNSSWPPDQRNDKMEEVLKDFLANEAMLSR